MITKFNEGKKRESPTLCLFTKKKQKKTVVNKQEMMTSGQSYLHLNSRKLLQLPVLVLCIRKHDGCCCRMHHRADQRNAAHDARLCLLMTLSDFSWSWNNISLFMWLIAEIRHASSLDWVSFLCCSTINTCVMPQRIPWIFLFKFIRWSKKTCQIESNLNSFPQQNPDFDRCVHGIFFSAVEQMKTCLKGVQAFDWIPSSCLGVKTYFKIRMFKNVFTFAFERKTSYLQPEKFANLSLGEAFCYYTSKKKTK